MKTTATKSQVQQAIDNVNKKHGYKIEFNRADQSGKWFNFTIKSKSGIPGARISHSGRNLASASWHAHGYLFDELLEINPDAVIHSNGLRLIQTAEIGLIKTLVPLAAPHIFLNYPFYNPLPNSRLAVAKQSDSVCGSKN